MKYEEIEKLANERKETELKLREQVDKKNKNVNGCRLWKTTGI